MAKISGEVRSVTARFGSGAGSYHPADPEHPRKSVPWQRYQGEVSDRTRGLSVEDSAAWEGLVEAFASKGVV